MSARPPGPLYTASRPNRGKLAFDTLLQCSFDTIEGIAHPNSNAVDRGDNEDPDQGNDQAVFDRSSTRLTLGETRKQFHDNSPNSRPWTSTGPYALRRTGAAQSNVLARCCVVPKHQIGSTVSVYRTFPNPRDCASKMQRTGGKRAVEPCPSGREMRAPVRITRLRIVHTLPARWSRTRKL